MDNLRANAPLHAPVTTLRPEVAQ
jgi:hypothetical protein